MLFTETIWHKVNEFLLSAPTLEQVVDFHASPKLQERGNYLLYKNREGEITFDKNEELDELTKIEIFVIRLKAKALAKLPNPPDTTPNSQ